MTEQQGGCLCGALRYAVAADPVRVVFCHCRFCQRLTGSAYFVEPIFRSQHVRLVAGAARTYDHISEGSGKRVTLHFCETCSAKVFLTFERFADVTGVYAGTFDDPNWFDRTPENSKHIFLAVAQQGTVIPPGIATYREHAWAADGTPVEPVIYDYPHVIGAEET